MDQSLTAYKPVTGPSRSDDRMIDFCHFGSCTPTVYVRDTEVAAYADVIQANGWRACLLDSFERLFEGAGTPVASCLVLDLSHRSVADVVLHGFGAASRPEMPIICIAGEADLAIVISIMKAGVFDVLTKPIAGEILLTSVRRALEFSEAILKERFEIRRIEQRYELLSKRERQVMALIVSGLLNKQAAAKLGISEITIKAHRGRVMRKMQASSFAGLVKMAEALKL